MAFSIDVQQSWSHLLATSETHYFLRGNGVPAATLDQAIPTSTAMQDYDDGRHNPVGTLISKGGTDETESDPVKHQAWTTASGNIDINGPVKLSIWSAMKDMDDTKGATVHAYLIDVKSNGTDIQLIASDTITRSTWSATGDWVEDTFDFGTHTRSLAVNRRLEVKIVVDGTSDDDMVFAYDDVFHRSHLQVGMTTANGDPLLTMGGSPLDWTEGDGQKVIDGGINLTDDGPNTQQWATVQITGGFQADQDELSYSDALFGTTMAYDASTGQMVFHGTATSNDYADILKKVEYNNSSENPVTTSRTVTFTVYDGENLSMDTQTILLTGVNDEPTVDATASDTGLEDQDVVYTHAQMLALLNAADVDNTSDELTIDITSVNNATFSKSGSGDLTDYTFTLTQPLHSANYDITFDYEVIDPETKKASGGPATITIQAVNDEPVLTIGGNQNVSEDTGSHTYVGFASTLSGGGTDESAQTFTYNVSNNNTALFAVGPSIDASGTLTYTLASDAIGTAVVTVSVMDNGGIANGGDNQSPDQQFSITIANANNDDAFIDINDTLSVDENEFAIIDNTLLKAGDVDLPNASSLVFDVISGPTLGQLELTTDPGNSIDSFTQEDIDNDRVVYVHGGAEAPLSDSFDFTVTDGIGSTTLIETFNISVDPQNDAPINVTPGTQSTAPDTALTFDAANGNQVSITDDDAGAANVQVTLTVTNGTVTLDMPPLVATTSGGETVVNTTAGQTQHQAVVAVRDNGDYVVAWSGKGGGGESDGVWIQVYSADGTPDPAGNLRVNTETSLVQDDPAIAMADDGSFVVIWTSESQDGSGSGIFGQRFDAAGNPLGLEFPVNTTWSNNQHTASVAMDADGDFVVVWEDQSGLDGQTEGIFMQRFNASGVPQGIETLVTTNWVGKQTDPKVAMDAAGNYVVTWSDNWFDGQNEGIFAQRFDKDGNTLGNQFQVNTHWIKRQEYSDIAMNDAGEFVIVWTSHQQDSGSTKGVYGQRYDANGDTVGGEFLINATVGEDQETPSVSMSASGGFVV
ncbi:MAG: hypothetical protein HKN47_18255, partial [Pirellulaceae bacterium]|nr:hypothetical protein [Pirellulaceae bacterium]